MKQANTTTDVENFELVSPTEAQFLPSVLEKGRLEPEAAGSDRSLDVARFREELRELREEVAALDRRDAAQHGGLKGEIAHLIRRIARLEALPKARPALR